MTEPLLRCLRWDAEGESRLRGLSDADWPGLWAAVEAGGGEALLARRLQMAGVTPPSAIGAKLRARVLAVAARNLAMRQVLADAIRTTGRPALLLKGVDVAERVYGNLGHRPMGDVDFLVRKEDARAFHDHLCARGFVGSPAFDARLLASPDAHHFVYHDANGLVLELHWRLSEGDDGLPPPALWESAIAHAAFAPKAFVMPPADLFLYLCLHLKHHLFETSLIQFWDLAELIRHPSITLDWTIIRAQARARRLERSVDLAFHVLREHLGVTPPLGLGRAGAMPIPQLPDTLSYLGRYPSGDHLSPRMASALAAQAPWTERLRALKASILPSRTEIRARHGSPSDGVWRDALSYLYRWRYLLATKLPVIVGHVRRGPGPTTDFGRMVTMRHYLHGNGNGNGNGD